MISGPPPVAREEAGLLREVVKFLDREVVKFLDQVVIAQVTEGGAEFIESPSLAEPVQQFLGWFLSSLESPLLGKGDLEVRCQLAPAINQPVADRDLSWAV